MHPNNSTTSVPFIGKATFSPCKGPPEYFWSYYIRPNRIIQLALTETTVRKRHICLSNTGKRKWG